MSGRLQRFRFRRILGAFGVALLAAPLPAQVRGSIRGSVVDPSGAPIRACVTLKSSPGRVEKQTPCAPDGSFALTGLAPGAYGVTVTGLGWVTRNYDKVVVNSETPVDLPVEMRMAPIRMGGITAVPAPVDTAPHDPDATPCEAQSAAPGETIRGIASLGQAAERLQNRYGRPVAYEEPVWRWRGDFDVYPPTPVLGGTEVWRVKVDTLIMPGGLTPDKTPVLDAAALTKVVDAYQAQNPERGRFRVLESGPWLQIVPTQARDESGVLQPAGSLLDTLVSVPVLRRSASEHLIALCQAVSSASGVTLEPNVSASPGNPFTRAYAANGSALRNIRAADAPFDWGTPAVTAREALLDLMNRSGTTLSWQLLCQHGGPCSLMIPPRALGPGGFPPYLVLCGNANSPEPPHPCSMIPGH